MLKFRDLITNRKTGETHREYTINQGDTFSLYARETNENQQLVKGFKFKICKDYPIAFFEKDYIFDEDNNKWICKINSEDTNTWEVNIDDNPYKYEIEATYIDDNKVSVELYDFYVDYQIGDR